MLVWWISPNCDTGSALMIIMKHHHAMKHPIAS